MHRIVVRRWGNILSAKEQKFHVQRELCEHFEEVKYKSRKPMLCPNAVGTVGQSNYPFCRGASGIIPLNALFVGVA